MAPLTAQVLHCCYVRHIDERSIIDQLRNDRLGVRAQGRSDMLDCCAEHTGHQADAAASALRQIRCHNMYFTA